MKLKNKLLPIVALSGIATVATPLVVSCSSKQDISVEFTIADSETTGEKTVILALDWNPSEDGIVFNNLSAVSETMGGKVNAEFAEESRPQNINLTFTSVLSQDLDDVVVEFDYEDKTQKIASHAKLENIHIDRYATEWNAEVEPVLPIIDDSGESYNDFPKAIYSTQIKNIEDYELSFIDPATGEESIHIDSSQSFMSKNLEDDNYIDLHIVAATEQDHECVTIKIYEKSSQTEFLSQMAITTNTSSIEIWNPNVERVATFNSSTGEFQTTVDNPIMIPVGRQQQSWYWSGLFDLNTGTTFVLSLAHPLFPYIKTEGGYDIFDFSGQCDEFKGMTEPITLTVLCNAPNPSWTWIYSHMYNITFVPQE